MDLFVCVNVLENVLEINRKIKPFFFITQSSYLIKLAVNLNGLAEELMLHFSEYYMYKLEYLLQYYWKMIKGKNIAE